MSAVTTSLRPRRAGDDRIRRRLRTTAAVTCAAIAAVYAAIALQLVTVVDGTAAEIASIQPGFATPAAGLFALGAFLLWRYDDRRLWAFGLVLQVLVFAVYLAVAPEREPAFELWGVLLRVLQVGLFVPLALLTFRRASWLVTRDR